MGASGDQSDSAMPEAFKVDRLDLRILAQLQKNGRMTNVDVADAVGLSPSPCLIRVKRLEQAGYIAGYGAQVQLEKLGDTLTVLDSQNQQRKIRLNGIDAPESGQDFGQVAKRNLSDLAYGKEVSVVWSKTDKYGRIIGTVFVGSTNVNLEQLKAGLAWFYRQYAGDVPL